MSPHRKGNAKSQIPALRLTDARLTTMSKTELSGAEFSSTADGDAGLSEGRCRTSGSGQVLADCSRSAPFRGAAWPAVRTRRPSPGPNAQPFKFPLSSTTDTAFRQPAFLLLLHPPSGAAVNPLRRVLLCSSAFSGKQLQVNSARQGPVLAQAVRILLGAIVQNRTMDPDDESDHEDTDPCGKYSLDGIVFWRNNV